MRILYQTILSHLVVAVPPAVILGVMVLDVNRSALLSEVQQVNLTVANRLRDAVSRQLDEQRLVLDHAERILDLPSTEPTAQRALLFSLVADGRVPYLAVYDASRAVDSVIRPTTDPHFSPPKLSESVAAEARTRGYAVGAAQFKESGTYAGVFVPWLRADEFLGYVGTHFDIASLEPTARELVTRHLDDGGQIEIINGVGRVLVSTEPGRAGRKADAMTPFGGLISTDLRSGIVAVETGRSMAYEDAAGARRLGSIVSAPELKWVIGSSRPEARALASIETVKRRTLALALAAALAAGLVGLLAARRVTQPLSHLTRTVRRSAREGFTEPVSVTGSTEVTALANTFNSAMGELDRHKRALSRKTQMQVRLARFLSPTALRELLTQEFEVEEAQPAEPVCVLYADLSAATEVTRDSDTENMVLILAEFYDQACEAVEEAGGVVDQFSGDAVVGIFRGASLETTAQSGLAAARSILESARRLRAAYPGRAEFIGQAVVGLASGETTVKEDIKALGGITVSGGLVERAAALMSEGNPGRIMLDETAHARLGLPPGSGLPRTTGQYELDPESLPPEVH